MASRQSALQASQVLPDDPMFPGSPLQDTLPRSYLSLFDPLALLCQDQSFDPFTGDSTTRASDFDGTGSSFRNPANLDLANDVGLRERKTASTTPSQSPSSLAGSPLQENERVKRRRAQNRKAQRAYRARKESAIIIARTRVAELERQKSMWDKHQESPALPVLRDMVVELETQNSSLRQEIDRLKKQLQAVVDVCGKGVS